MRLRRNVNFVKFIKKVKECETDVYLETEEGDRLNLKSELSQYVFVTLSEQDSLLGNSRIVCSEKDKEKLEDFIEPD